MNIDGVAVRIRGDDIDTDVMYPGAYLNLDDPAEMAPHLFEGFDPWLRERLGERSVLVVDANFGIGSSREHVPLAMKANGVQGLIGWSFARIFFRNCVNLGLAIVVCPEAVEVADDGSAISVNESEIAVDGVSFPRVPQAPLLTELVRAGGLTDWTAARLARHADLLTAHEPSK